MIRPGATSVVRRAANVGAKQARGMATGKDLKFGVDGRASMLLGVDKLADAVQVDLHTDHRCHVTQLRTATIL
jgi:hypothetical protein